MNGRRWPLAVLLLLAVAGGAEAAPPSPGHPAPRSRAERPSDRWHREHHGYHIEEPAPPERRFRLGLCIGAGVRAGIPGTVMGVGDLYVSLSRPGAFSLFAGAGLEVETEIRAAVFTLGWGGVRTIRGARRQTGFFGAFLRYRDFRGATDASRRDAFSVGTEIGGGTLGLTFELGASRRTDGAWHLLAYMGLKVIRAW